MGQNDIWVLNLWPSTKYIIRGKVVASPKSGPWWALWIRVYPRLVHAAKCSNYALTNLLFGLCRSVWISELLVNLPSPILEFQHALLPPKCYEPRSAPQLLFLLLSSPLDSQLNPSRSLGVHQMLSMLQRIELQMRMKLWKLREISKLANTNSNSPTRQNLLILSWTRK